MSAVTRFLLLAALSFSAVGRSVEEPARLLVHLLAYIGADYGVAVQGGKILNQNEYQEQKEFLGAAFDAVKKVPALADNSDFNGRLGKLRALIDGRGAAEEVATLSRDLTARALKATGLNTAPVRWPNLAHGREIFDKSCAQCHGVNGKGDGPSSAGLDPKPTDFHDAKMADISPFQAFNTIRLGVNGTAMVAFEGLSDAEVWDLAFYVQTFRYAPVTEGYRAPEALTKFSLDQVAASSDAQLLVAFPGDDVHKAVLVRNARLQTAQSGDTASLTIAHDQLRQAQDAAERGEWKAAKEFAVVAYLEGVEPVEPRMRAKDLAAVGELEGAMAGTRAAIEQRLKGEPLAAAFTAAHRELDRARDLLARKDSSPAFTFSVAFGIFLREAFEAVLIIITLLGVLRALNARKAALYVHAGWLLALGVGLAAWFLSGWLVAISGAQREMLEGSISFVAVLVLLYFGFWLHRRTEIGKWRAFINEMAKHALDDKRLLVLAGASFMAVFREAFEVVLFLRALLIESGGNQSAALGAGVLSAFVIVLVLSSLVVRYSVRIPLRQLFSISSFLMVALAVILIGKAMHSFQETGWLTVTALPVHLRIDLFGVYPTYETLLPQLLILGVSVAAWLYGRRDLRLKERIA